MEYFRKIASVIFLLLLGFTLEAGLVASFQLQSLQKWHAGLSRPGKLVRLATMEPPVVTEKAAAPAPAAPAAPPAAGPASTAIVGAGPSGLLTAIMLARRGYRDITVYDKLPEPEPPHAECWVDPERSYNIGIGGRGQLALRKFGCMAAVNEYAADVNARRDWSPEAPPDAPRDTDLTGTRTYVTKVIARDRLTAVLLAVARAQYADRIKVEFQANCEDVQWPETAGGAATLTIRQTKTVQEIKTVKKKLPIHASPVTKKAEQAKKASSKTIVSIAPDIIGTFMKDVAAKTEFITIAPMMKKNNNKQQSKSFFDELAEFFGGSGESKDVSEGYLTKRKTAPKMEKELMEVSQSIEVMDETTLKNSQNLLPLTVSQKQEGELTKQQQELMQQEEEGGARGAAAAAPLLLEVATEVVAGPPPPPTEEERPGETVTEETVVATREVEEVRAVSAPLVVGADGVRSAVRAALARDPQAAARGCRYVEYPQRNTRVYKTIPLRIPDSWRKDVNYSARTKSGINIDALPSKGGVFVGVVLFKPENTRVSDLKTGAEARALFEEVFPQFADIITDEDYENFVKKPVSKLPEFTYTKSVLNKQGCGVLVGDTIHTVKPYFGLGLNSAFEDISYLDDCLNEANDDMEAALEAYSQKRAKNAEVLVKISHSLDGGFFSFVLPLILDSITNKIAPKLFAPNTIRMLQREDMSFIQVLRRKRMDRAMQAAIGAAALAGLCKAVIFLYSSVFKLLLRFAFAGLASGF